MGDRMKVFGLIILLVVDLYNIKLARRNTFRVKKSPYIFAAGLILALVVFYLCLNYSKDLLGFLVGILAVGLFFTFTLGQGIREDGFLVFLGTTPILKFIHLEGVKNLSILYVDDDSFKLRIKTKVSTYEQFYDIDSLSFVEEYLDL